MTTLHLIWLIAYLFLGGYIGKMVIRREQRKHPTEVLSDNFKAYVIGVGCVFGVYLGIALGAVWLLGKLWLIHAWFWRGFWRGSLHLSEEGIFGNFKKE